MNDGLLLHAPLLSAANICREETQTGKTLAKNQENSLKRRNVAVLPAQPSVIQ